MIFLSGPIFHEKTVRYFCYFLKRSLWRLALSPPFYMEIVIKRFFSIDKYMLKKSIKKLCYSLYYISEKKFLKLGLFSAARVVLPFNLMNIFPYVRIELILCGSNLIILPKNKIRWELHKLQLLLPLLDVINKRSYSILFRRK